MRRVKKKKKKPKIESEDRREWKEHTSFEAGRKAGGPDGASLAICIW